MIPVPIYSLTTGCILVTHNAAVGLREHTGIEDHDAPPILGGADEPVVPLHAPAGQLGAGRGEYEDVPG